MKTRFALICLLAAFACARSPRPARADGEVTFGGQWWTQSAPEAAYQQFREVPQGGFVRDYWLRDSLARYQFVLDGSHALRRDQSAGFRLYDGVRWWTDLRYQQIPHLISEITRTAYDQVTPGVFRLPDSVQALNQRNPAAYATTMGDLVSTAHPVEAGFRTDIADGALALRPARGWQIRLRGERRERSGTIPYSGPFGFNNTIELPAPVNQRMWDADVSASYVRERLTVQALAGFSAFQNRIPSMTWDNPRELTDITGGSTSSGNGTGSGRLALAPDNRVVRGGLALGLRLPREATLSASLGLSQSTQDQGWIPLTVNQAILAANPQLSLDSLGSRSTDGKATAITQDYRLSGRIVPRLRGTVRFHQYHYDNRTPVHVLPGIVLLDETFEPTDPLNPEVNKPFGNKQTTVGGDLDFDLWRRIALGATYEHRIFDRTFREVAKDNEDVVELKLRVPVLESAELEAAYHYGDRRLDRFDVTEFEAGGGDTTLTEQPGLRRFDVADRRRHQARAGISWSPLARVDLSVQYDYALDDYPDSKYGLQRAEENGIMAEAVLHVDPRTDLSGGWGYSRLRTRMESNTSSTPSAAPVISADDSTNWIARIRDADIYVFARADWRPKGRLSYSLEYEYSEDNTSYGLNGILNVYTTAPRLPAQDLPTTRFRHHSAQLQALYRLRSDIELAARYVYDGYVVHDFAVQGIPLFGVSLLSPTQTAVYLGDNTLSYRAHQVALLATRRF